MRIRSIEINGFRGFAGEIKFTFSSNIIVLRGANGVGKTSLLDAILWALTGRLKRFPDKKERVVSLYSISQRARVKLELETLGGDSVEIIRTELNLDGENEKKLLLIQGGQKFEGVQAEAQLNKILLRDAAAEGSESDAVETILSRAVYLQQDTLRKFIEDDTDQERFDILSHLIGAGKLNSLRAQFDRQRLQWSKEVNRREADLEAATKRHEALKFDQSRAAAQTYSTEEVRRRYESWCQSLAALSIDVSGAPSFDNFQASSFVRQNLQLLEGRLAEKRRDYVELRSAAQQIKEFDFEALEDEIDDVDARISVLQAEQIKGSRTAFPAEATDQQQEMHIFARIALRHLSQQCPVCTQHYDRGIAEANLRNHLIPEFEEEMEGNEDDSEKFVFEDISDLVRVRAELENRLNLESVRRDLVYKTVLERFRIDMNSAEEGALDSLLSEIEASGVVLSTAVTAGRELDVLLASRREESAKESLSRQIDGLLRSLKPLEDEVNDLRKTRKLAVTLIDLVRESAIQSAQNKAEVINPILQEIYARIDPHPSLTFAYLDTVLQKGKGHLRTYLRDTNANYDDIDPIPVLSSSQLNALAIAVFLAVNLSLQKPALDTIVLDDPLQHLDSINMLGLVDVMRRIKPYRQIVISTHDERLADLIERKLRPVGANESLHVVKFSGWSRRGPFVDEYDVPSIHPSFALLN